MNVSPSLPMHEQGKDSATTKATLTEGKITLNKDSNPTETTAKALGINTDLAEANKQVETPKDINQVLKEQNAISQNVGHIATVATTFSNRQASKLEDEAKAAEKAGDHQTAEAKREEAKSWETGGENKRKVDAITSVLSLALAGQSPQAIATGAVSPYINQAIEQATESYPELNIPAHILWGAIEAELTGGKAATGAIAAGVGELAAPILSQALYGDKKPNELTEAEKQQVLNLSKLVAGVASGLTATGNSAENIAAISQGIQVAENAVENNFFKEDIRQQEEEYAVLNLFSDDKKAAEFLSGVKAGEGEAIINDIKDNLEGIVNLVTSPIETLQDAVRSVTNLVTNIDKVGGAVTLSVTEWQLLYEKALENDPKLAGKMLGEVKGHLNGLSVPTQLTVSATVLKGIKDLADNTGKLFLGRGVLSNKDVGIGWGMIDKQGKAWEAYLQNTLPKGTIDLNTIKPNFKTFDHLLPDGTAISAKTLNMKATSYTNNPKRITAQLNKYVDDMVNFKGDGKKGGLPITVRDISSREMYLAIPSNSTRQQMEAINKSLDYTKSQGVKIIVKEIK